MDFYTQYKAQKGELGPEWEDRLAHSSGEWVHHKYIKKIGDKYIYNGNINNYTDAERAEATKEMAEANKPELERINKEREAKKAAEEKAAASTSKSSSSDSSNSKKSGSGGSGSKSKSSSDKSKSGSSKKSGSGSGSSKKSGSGEKDSSAKESTKKTSEEDQAAKELKQMQIQAQKEALQKRIESNRAAEEKARQKEAEDKKASEELAKRQEKAKTLAQEVVDGKHGTLEEQKKEFGDDFSLVWQEVHKLLEEKKKARETQKEMEHSDFYTNYLIHHGILGMKWGRRRYQNEDGTLTDLGRKHYGVGPAREETAEEHAKNREDAVASGDPVRISKYKNELSNSELKSALERIDYHKKLRAAVAEAEYNNSFEKKVNDFSKKTKTLSGLGDAGISAYNVFAKVINSTAGTDLPIINDKSRKERETELAAKQQKLRENELKLKEKQADLNKKDQELKDKKREAKSAALESKRKSILAKNDADLLLKNQSLFTSEELKEFMAKSEKLDELEALSKKRKGL